MKNQFVDEYADRFAVAEQKPRLWGSGFAAFEEFETEVEEFVDNGGFPFGIAAPVDVVFLCETLLVALAEVSAVIEQNFDFESAVDAQPPVEERFEFALIDLHVSCCDDFDGEPVGGRENFCGFAVAGLNGRAEEIADPEHIRLGADPPVFTEHSDPASGASGDDFHILQRKRDALDDEGGTEQRAASGVLDEQSRIRLFLVNHDFFLQAEEAGEVDQTVEEFRSLFRVERKLGSVLLGVDGKVADDLTVLLREVAELERDGEVFPEMELADVVEISRIVAVVPVQHDREHDPFPLARRVREIGFRVDGDGCVGRCKHLLEQLGQSGEFEPGILSRMIRFLMFLRLDGVFRMMQTRRDGVTAESVRAGIA